MTTGIHDLAHRWQGRPSDGTLNPGWDCPHCLLSSSVAFDALCPDLVAAALRKVEAERDEARREFWSLAAVSLVCILALSAVVVFYA